MSVRPSTWPIAWCYTTRGLNVNSYQANLPITTLWLCKFFLLHVSCGTLQSALHCRNANFIPPRCSLQSALVQSVLPHTLNCRLWFLILTLWKQCMERTFHLSVTNISTVIMVFKPIAMPLHKCNFSSSSRSDQSAGVPPSYCKTGPALWRHTASSKPNAKPWLAVGSIPWHRRLYWMTLTHSRSWNLKVHSGAQDRGQYVIENWNLLHNENVRKREQSTLQP